MINGRWKKLSHWFYGIYDIFDVENKMLNEEIILNRYFTLNDANVLGLRIKKHAISIICCFYNRACMQLSKTKTRSTYRWIDYW